MASVTDHQPGNQRRSCMLVVEDDENDFFLFKRAFSKAVCEAVLIHARDGQEAMVLLQQPSAPVPNLIVTDLKMPRVNGFELLGWLKTQPRLAEVPTVVLASSSESRDQEKAQSLGAKAYYTKPSEHHDLISLVHELCDDYAAEPVAVASL